MELLESESVLLHEAAKNIRGAMMLDTRTKFLRHEHRLALQHAADLLDLLAARTLRNDPNWLPPGEPND